MRLPLRLLLAGLFVVVPLVTVLESMSLSGCGDCNSCGVSGPYCFDLQTDTFHCGSCDNACLTATVRDQVCQDGQCVKASCSVAGGCTGDAGICCGDTCCASPDFCCTTKAGPRCISGNGESQCPP
ncbi:MAG: hypothetical protein QM820_03555 [Minicystis sp.]